jgi:hypothetical protein
MPHHVDGVLLHAMYDTELSRVRTALHCLRILAASSPHPIQLNCQPASHRYLGNTLVPTHRQMDTPTSPVRMDTHCCLGRLHQQKTQQGTALLANVPQPLLATTGVLARNHPHVRADLLAPWKSCRSSDDQHLSQCRKRAHARMGHQSQNLGSVSGFSLDGDRQLFDRRIHTVQQFQQLLPAPTRPGS